MFGRPMEIPSAEQALPGRNEPMQFDPRHAVGNHCLKSHRCVECMEGCGIDVFQTARNNGRRRKEPKALL